LGILGFKDKILYYISDSEVYSTTGKKGKLVSGIDEDAAYFGADLHGSAVRTPTRPKNQGFD
jgi:hypothetical protein